VGFHLAVIGSLIAYAFIHGRMGETWGTSSPGGAINATLVSSAPALPLPSDQKPTDNVLATDKPSPAPAPPAPPAPKAEVVPDTKAIPIADKLEKIKPVPSKVDPKQAPKPSVVPPARPQPAPKQQYVAQYGEGSPTHMAKATPGTSGSSNPVAVAGGDFGERFGWYVDIIKRKVAQSWLTSLVDPRTAAGTEVKITFVLDKSGAPSHATISQASSSPTLNQSAMQAIQRVDTFGSLPPGYNGSRLSVEYTFTYEGH
jgi:protein TonB